MRTRRPWTSDGRRGASLAAIFEVTGKALDVDPADVEQMVLMLQAPAVNWRKSKA